MWVSRKKDEKYALWPHNKPNLFPKPASLDGNRSRCFYEQPKNVVLSLSLSLSHTHTQRERERMDDNKEALDDNAQEEEDA